MREVVRKHSQGQYFLHHGLIERTELIQNKTSQPRKDQLRYHENKP